MIRYIGVVGNKANTVLVRIDTFMDDLFSIEHKNNRYSDIERCFDDSFHKWFVLMITQQMCNG